MARVAIRAVVDVPPNAGVMRVHLGLRMTRCARENGVIGWIRMTVGADAVRISVVRREPRVIERRTRPGRGRVARFTRRRIASGGVVWVGSPRVVGGMARVATVVG